MDCVAKFKAETKLGLLTVIFIAAFGFSINSFAHTLLGESWPAGQVVVNVDLAASNPPGANQPNIVSNGPTTAQLQTAYLEAMQLWSDNSTFVYIADTASGAIDPCPAPSSVPGNGVKFAGDECGDSFGSSTLAIQQSWFSGPELLKTGTIFNNNLQWDIYSGNYTGVAEFKRVAVHELGHGLGLGHEVSNTAIMAPIVSNLEVPQTDDIAGVAAIYDTDADGVGLANDNCPQLSNSDQANADADGLGDVCDNDIDGDGIWNGTGVDVDNDANVSSGSLWSAGPASTNSDFPYITQSFIAGVTGHLATIKLPIFCPSGNLSIQVREASGDQPTSTSATPVNHSQTFDSSDGLPTTNSGGVDFTFTNPPMLTAGNQYAAVVTASSSCSWFVASSFADGHGYLSTNNSFWQSINDLGIATTMTPSPVDNCPYNVNPDQTDTNSNGVGDACEVTDTDGDGIDDDVDNCPAIANADQLNFDGDLQGDACDSDDDNDNLLDDDEVNIYSTDPLNADTDGDGYNDDLEVSLGTDPNIPNINISTAPWFYLCGLSLLFAFINYSHSRRS